MYKKYIAIDQDGNTRFVNNPRKDLLDYHGRKHADKIYCDIKGGGMQHIGYIVSGHWYEVMRLSPMKEAVE